MFKKINLIQISLVFFLLVLICSLIILSFTPPISKDALIHHLAVPKLYVKHGGIYEIQTIIFSYYPMNMNLIYIIPLLFNNDIMPKYIHLFFGLLTASLIFLYLKHRINYIYSLFGVIFFLSIPVIVKLSTSVYVDLGLIFFTTASLLAVLRWLENSFPVKWLIISGICCGLAMGTKYNGLIVFFILTLFVPFIYLRCGQNDHRKTLRSLSYCVVFFSIALLVFSPWMIKNFIWTNNPIYPLYDSFFNFRGEAAGPSLGVFGIRAVLYQENWWEIALVPLRIFFQGQDGNPQYFDGALNPFLLIFAIFAFYQFKTNPVQLKREKKILLVFSILYFAFAFFSSGMRIRYVLPIVPPMVILVVFGLRNIFKVISGLDIFKSRKLGYLIIFVAILSSLSINIKYLISQFNYIKPFDYIKGTLNRDEYIEKYRPEYAAMKYINKNLPDNARILFIFMGNRGYYCDREYVFDMLQNKSLLRQFIITSNNSEQVLLQLVDLGITHLLIHMGLFNKWVEMNLEPSDQQLLAAFFSKHVKKLFNRYGYGVYKVENFL